MGAADVFFVLTLAGLVGGAVVALVAGSNHNDSDESKKKSFKASGSSDLARSEKKRPAKKVVVDSAANRSGAVTVLSVTSKFNNIEIEVPFTVLIEPSRTETGAQYSIELGADDAVRAALRIYVNNQTDTLHVEMDGNFHTRRPICLTIRLPANALHGVKVTHPLNNVTSSNITTSVECLVLVAPGFKVTLPGQIFNAEINNTSTLVVKDLAAQTVHGITMG